MVHPIICEADFRLKRTETLTGLSTVRAYRGQEQFIKNADDGLDLENRAYYMTVAIQQWLAVRLDFFGNILVLGIALFAAGFRATVDPSKIGVVLSYTLSITQTFCEFWKHILPYPCLPWLDSSNGIPVRSERTTHERSRACASIHRAAPGRPP